MRSTLSDSICYLEETIQECRKCTRLVSWREEVAKVKRKAFLEWEYWGKPVPGFGDHKARVLVVGLAPGAHGSNRTGRMFTGDASGDILYRNLHSFGFANQPNSLARSDGLQLKGLYISAICRCVPPGNKPTREEINNCLPYLLEEMNAFENLLGIVVLGRIAYAGIARIFLDTGISVPVKEFSHGNLLHPNGTNLWILQSYHPSRQNTQTGRLTEEMFSAIWVETRRLLAI